MGRRSDRDPFEVIGPIPKGKTYQWAAISVMGDTDVALHSWLDLKEAGWKPVPPARHPKMPRRGKQIYYGGQVLVERSQKLTDSARLRDVKAASALNYDSPIKSGDPLTYSPSGMGFRSIAAAAAGATLDQQVIRDEIEAAGGAVKVEIGIALTDREIDACAYLSLTAKEYARRKVLMMDNGTAWLGHGTTNVLLERSPGVFGFGELKVHVKET